MSVAANSSAIADSQNSAVTHNQMSTSVHFRCPPWDCDVTRAVNLARSLCSQGSYPHELVPANASAIAVAYRGCLCLSASYVTENRPLNTGQLRADPGGQGSGPCPPNW